MDFGIFTEGKEYISASRAAEKSGYTSDYIGQLCRAKKIPGRLVGRTWYLDLESLLNHKKEAQPGKRKQSSSTAKNSPGQFTYETDERPLLPELLKSSRSLGYAFKAPTFNKPLAALVLTLVLMTTLGASLWGSHSSAIFSQASKVELATASAISAFSDSVEFLLNSLHTLRNFAFGKSSRVALSPPTPGTESSDSKALSEETSAINVELLRSDLRSELEQYVQAQISQAYEPRVIYQAGTPSINTTVLRREILLADTRPTVTRQSTSDVDSVSTAITRLTESSSFINATLTNPSISGGSFSDLLATGSTTLRNTAGPQLILTDGVADSNPFNFRQVGSTLYIATSSQTTLATSSKTILTLDGTTGNLGVGTTTPRAALDIVGSIASSRIDPQSLTLIRSNTFLRFSGFNLGYVNFSGTDDGYGNVSMGARINSRTEGGGGGGFWSTTAPASLNLQTTQAGATTSIPRIWITSKGLVGIGAFGDASEGLGDVFPTNQLEVTASNGATAKTVAFSTIKANNTATSTTASLIKSGVRISSTGAWTGSASQNIGLYIESVTGGTTNYDAIFNGGGTVGVGTSTPSSAAMFSIASSTIPQLLLTDGVAGSVPFNFRQIGSALYIATSSQTSFATSSNIILTLSGTTGYVGISTTTPSAKFSVSGSAYFDGGTVTGTTFSATTSLLVGAGVGTEGGNDNLIKTSAASAFLNIKGGQGLGKISIGNSLVDIINGNAGDTRFSYGASSDTSVGTLGLIFSRTGGFSLGSTFATTDPGAGNAIIQGVLGIGTTTPNHLLTLASSTAPQLMLTDGVAGSNPFTFRQVGSALYISTSSQTSFATSTIPALVINGTTGFVGIGTTTPSVLLEIGSTGTTPAAKIRLNDAADNQQIIFANGGGDRFTIKQGAAGLQFIGALASNTGRWFNFTSNGNAIQNGDNSNRGFGINLTFNSAAQKFYGLVTDITNNASAVNSALADFRVAGVSKIFFDINGNVGIGTTSPSNLLTIASSTAPQIMLTDGVAGSVPFTFRQIGSTLYIATSSQTSFATSSSANLILDGTTGNLLIPQGRVGIGTATPGAKVAISDARAGTAGQTTLLSNWFGTNLGTVNGTYIGIQGGLQLNGGTISGGTWVGVDGFIGSNGTTASVPSAIAVRGTIMPSGLSGTNASFTNAYAFFAASSTMNSATAVNMYGMYVDTMKVTGVTNGYGVYQVGASDTNYFAGNTGFGTTTPWATLSVVGKAVFPTLQNNATGYYACINTAGGGAELATSTTACGASSIRFKENVQNITYGLADILKMRPVSFDWKHDFMPDGTHQIGFIAEEMQQVIPEVIGYDNHGQVMNLDYAKLTSVIVQAIKDVANVTGVFKDNLIAWLGDAGNGIQKFFAKEVHTEKLCVKKSDGTEICLTGDEVSAIAASAGSGYSNVSTSPIPNDGDTTPPTSTSTPETASTTPNSQSDTNNSPPQDGGFSGDQSSPPNPEVTPEPTEQVSTTE